MIQGTGTEANGRRASADSPAERSFRREEFWYRVAMTGIAVAVVTFIVLVFVIPWLISRQEQPYLVAMRSARNSAQRLIGSPEALNIAAASGSMDEATSAIASALGTHARDHKNRPMTVRITSRTSERLNVHLSAQGRDGIDGTDDDIVAEMAFVRVDRWVIDHIDCIHNGRR